MEPIASSGPGASPRSLGGGGGELAALLRDGRILSAEVLTKPGEGTLLLALGRHVIPAESGLQLEPGERFLVRVKQGPEGTALERLLAPPATQETLLAALRDGVGERRPLGELFGALARALRAALTEPNAPPELRTLLEGLLTHSLRPESGAKGLRALVGGLGQGHEAALAALLTGRVGRASFERLRGDLKALLLGALATLEESGAGGPVREAVVRALVGLESEQLLNLARERTGEPLLFSFPFPDPSAEAERWATLRWLVPAWHGRAEASDQDTSYRLTLGLELTRLGPLRADFALTPARLSLRVLVTRADVAQRVEAGLELLRRRVGDGRRAVDASVRLGTPGEAELGLRALDIRYLREHHLMNVAG